MEGQQIVSWSTEWHAISNRIQGLLDAATFILKFPGPKGAALSEIINPAQDIFRCIVRFEADYGSNLSHTASKCLHDFTDRSKAHFESNWSSLPTEGLERLLTGLASFRSEFSYHLSDTQVIARRLTERAFVHLQRSIIVDTSLKERWGEAFQDTPRGEVRCEQLGAIHLLQHGIWGFKVGAKGGRTDLILREPIDTSKVESTAEALVLTEWKVVRSPKETSQKAEDAFQQALKYASGVLGGFELTGYRYLIMVSEKKLDMPPNKLVDRIQFQYINIPVDPDVPSMRS